VERRKLTSKELEGLFSVGVGRLLNVMNAAESPLQSPAVGVWSSLYTQGTEMGIMEIRFRNMDRELWIRGGNGIGSLPNVNKVITCELPSSRPVHEIFSPRTDLPSSVQ
jgi:hypothetical protein